MVWGGLEDLAATDSPATWVAVPWALGVFTAEFGMGSGGSLPARATRSSSPPRGVGGRGLVGVCEGWCGLLLCVAVVWADRAIRTGRLRALPHFHPRPIDVLVLHGPRGDLVLRRVSRLDAFSGYPVRT